MITLTTVRQDGTESKVLVSTTNVVGVDADTRGGDSKSVVTLADGKKLWVKETVEEIAVKVGAK